MAYLLVGDNANRPFELRRINYIFPGHSEWK